MLIDDAELSAAEIVRRAERCIGLAIRKGQEEGRIAQRGDIGARGGKVGSRRGGHLGRTSEIFGSRDEGTDTYAMTDGVTDAQFESAISEAKAEGNLSRANVVRKVRIERRLGELLAETAGSGRHKQKSHDATFGRLPEGVTRSQSSRWQALGGSSTC